MKEFWLIFIQIEDGFGNLGLRVIIYEVDEGYLDSVSLKVLKVLGIIFPSWYVYSPIQWISLWRWNACLASLS